MAVRKVIQAGHVALHRKNKKITSFKSSKLKKLQRDLIDTMNKTNLIGVAASQIAENFMVFVTHPRNTRARKLPKTDKLRIYINPKIVLESKKQNLIYEGCGSVSEGKLFGPVLRPQEIEIEGFDQNAKKFKLRCDGILARVIQHEMDHVMGKEFITKVSDHNQMMDLEYYKKNIRSSKLQKENSRITKIEYKSL